MKKMHVALLLILIQFGYSQIDSLALYHPLQMGNGWLYLKTIKYSLGGTDTSYIHRKKIGDTLVGGRIISIILGKNLTTGAVSIFHNRYDSITHNFYAGLFPSENLMDSTACSTPGTIFNSLQLTSVSPINFFNVNTVVRNIQTTGVIDVYSVWEYTRGFGLTYYEYYHNTGGLEEKMKLIYAKFDGKEYGTNPLKVSLDSLAQYYALRIGNERIYKKTSSFRRYMDPTIVSVSFFSRKATRDTIINSVPKVIIEEKDLKTGTITPFYERYDTLTGAFYRQMSSTEDMLDSVHVTTPNKMFNGRFMMFVNVIPDTILGKPTITRTTQQNITG